MRAGNNVNGIFVGSGSLLISCAEHWLSRGQEIQGVVADCPEVSTWATSRGIDRISGSDKLAVWLARRPFDFLFSIVNHAIIDAAVLTLPQRHAINFHDSLLPAYSGFNATSWAILRGETHHGVTWHEMSGEVDAGPILLQQAIEISDDDTAFSLGVKCAEAGRDSFISLVELVLAEAASGVAIETIAPAPAHGFHRRSDRPGAGFVDFRNSAKDVHAFIRALDLGSEDNWMCRPKIATPSGVYLVGTASLVSGSRSAGEVIALDRAGVTVAVADGAIKLSRIVTLDGSPVDPLDLRLAAGQIVLAPQATDAQAASDFDRAITRHERFWVARIANQRSPAIADLRLHTDHRELALVFRKLSPSLTAKIAGRRGVLIAALAGYLARIGEGGAFDLAIAKSVPDGLAPIYSDLAPMRVEVDLSAGFDGLLERAGAELAMQDRRLTFARDVVSRYGALRSRDRTAQQLSIGVRLARAGDLDPAAALVPGTSLTLICGDDQPGFAWAYDRRAISDADLARLSDRIEVLLESAFADLSRPVAELDILSPAEREMLLTTWQDTTASYAFDQCVHQLFEQQAGRTPNAIAVRFKNNSLTYRQLDQRSNAVAEQLRRRGVGPDALVGVCIERSLDLIVGLLGVLKAGGAYVPLDPVYPRERLSMMLEDSRAKVVISQRSLAARFAMPGADVLCIEDIDPSGAPHAPQSGVTPKDLAYVIFTSGSTGRPKGVMVTHGNVANFFAGMDARIGARPGVWLAVTSVSFDISVLELFWTLTRGFEVVIQGESDRASLASEAPAQVSGEPMAFGLFYFAADQGGTRPGGAYRLLLEGAKFADTHDFSAVWTPERHFHAFGGLYPNPAVTTAALATITSRVALRAGSIVLPLHNPLRVAEDWSVIDQLSGGRVGLSFASGWHADDFSLMPENYERRREIMVESIETVLKLWSGEKIDVKNGQNKTISVSVLPRPLQAAPPIWIASAGSVDTFKLAGRLGANVLTNMLGQDLADLKNKFAAYRAARLEAGHAGPGNVTVMLHTFVCEHTETARELARKPFCDYLTSSFDLIKVAPSMFPAFRQPSLDQGHGQGFDASRFTAEDMAALMDHAFDRYFETAGLFGSPEKALGMIESLKAIGANEVACLIDFGIDPEIVLASLPHLDRLRQLANAPTSAENDAAAYGIVDQIRNRGVTHLQCTPSMARMLTGDPDGLASLAGLEKLLLGGEALPVDLAATLLPVVGGEIHNMYGPTETTIWSTTSQVRAGQPITIGRPIANTVIRILDVRSQLTPVGVAGELCIGGAGVVRGYLDRPDLTAERFVQDPCDPSGRLYRTGDLARYRDDGEIEFLGRLDHQVKLNGYRIELGEIEAVLGKHPAVRQNVVVARADGALPQLVAYIIPARQASVAASDNDRVSQWKTLWDEAYKLASDLADPRFNITGWTSSYTGAQIPADEMLEWLDQVERSVLALSPRRVLEIGCGVGMVLYRLAPHVEHYTAVDISPHALETIRNELKPEERARVTLMQKPAHALEDMAPLSCDTVVINSVAQYFPDSAYLASVLMRASELVSDGGHIFIGDVRSRDHLDAFHTLTTLNQAPGHIDAVELASRIDRRAQQEGELVLSEAFFHALAREMPRVTHVGIALKPGKADNEMNAFRYDVTLHIGAAAPKTVQLPPASRLETLDAIRDALSAVPPVLLLQDLPNARLATVYAARSSMAERAGLTADEIRKAMARFERVGIDPAALINLHPDYTVDLVWARSGDPARFDAVLRHKSTGPRDPVVVLAPRHDHAPSRYANAPSAAPVDHHALFDDLRAHLRDFLPEYMIPSIFVAMDAFPLTPNGKIDRKRLPAPVRELARRQVDHVAPSNALEESIASVWRSLLNVERVGLKDNIFDLGANSLLTAQANQRLSTLLNRKVSLVSMFRYPTIESLAAHLNEDKSSRESDMKAVQAQADRKKDAAARRRELRGALES